MTRVFGRGQLKAAVLAALAQVEPANGYAVMQALAEAVGGSWKPSPGAIYPALLALEDAGLIATADDGTGARVYSLTAAGRAGQPKATEALTDAAARAVDPNATVTLGSLIDAFASAAPGRSRRLPPDVARAVGAVLADTGTTLSQILDKEHPDG